jgi:hypothetical protein
MRRGKIWLCMGALFCSGCILVMGYLRVAFLEAPEIQGPIFAGIGFVIAAIATVNLIWWIRSPSGGEFALTRAQKTWGLLLGYFAISQLVQGLFFLMVYLILSGPFHK